MSRRLLRMLIWLYPRRWRRRYGAELEELARELAANHDRTRARLALGLLVSGLAERTRGLIPRAVIVILVVTGLITGAVLAHSPTAVVKKPDVLLSSRTVVSTKTPLRALTAIAQGQTCFVSSVPSVPECRSTPCVEPIVAATPRSSTRVTYSPTGAFLRRSTRSDCASNPSVPPHTFLVRVPGQAPPVASG
jgi:hypothetical protein